jgi:hypothetical protein
MARRHRPFILPLLILLILSAAFLFAAWRLNDLPFTSLSRLFKPRKISASWSILEEIRALNELETAAYDMKVVFPFDFTGRDNADWVYLKMQYDRSPELFLSKADTVRDTKWKFAGLYALCRRVGIDPGRPDYRFVVMTVSIRAGVDLDLWMKGFSAGEPSEDVGGIQIRQDDKGRKILEIKSAPVTVTSFTVEDRDGSSDGFPDVPLTPERWRLLVEGLQPELRKMALDGGLLETAAEESELFLREIFTAAGYDDVIFTD